MRDRGIMNCFSWMKLVLIVSVQASFMLCWSLNDEGIALLKFRDSVVNDPFGALTSWNKDGGETYHCSWFGIGCSEDGYVVSLNLRNLCLKGTLAPELANLLHLKSIILQNNSFYGTIPEDIGELKELELLDLGHNNLSGPLLPNFGYNIPNLLLDNNDISCRVFPKLREHMLPSEVHLKKEHVTGMVEVPTYTRHNKQPADAVQIHRRMFSRKLLNHPPLPPNLLYPFLGKPTPPLPAHPPRPPREPKPPPPSPSPSPPSYVPQLSPQKSVLPPVNPRPAGKRKLIVVVAAAVGGFAGLVLAIGIYLWRSNKVTHVAPWAAGLSGQLQKAFVTGIPNLKKSQLETACEGFSNVIGPSSLGKIYKGTLSNGIEIAVISLPVTSAKGWSRNLESQFRTKIKTLSKVNHKNFVSLIGYCEEKKPFTRMLVFEYAPNGSLFEHLHIREAEHLDWLMRLRVMMGMAYCLEHMHQLSPPRTHPNLNSSSVSLSEDYAAKISDFCVWNEIAGSQVQTVGMESLRPSSATPEDNVYSFGLVLLEIVTGRLPLSLESNSTESWVPRFLRGEKRLDALVDPMLRHYNRQQLDRINDVIRKCLHPDRKQRLTMKDVTARLQDITGLDKNKASPSVSPLWWAELEISSSVNAD